MRDTKARITGKAAVTSMTNTFTFTEVNHNVVPGWKVWYMDINMIGRHFLVYSEKEPKIKRHYTICCTMQPELLRALRALAKAVLRGQEIAFPDEWLLGQDNDSIIMTLKNYKKAKGLSTQLHYS